VPRKSRYCNSTQPATIQKQHDNSKTYNYKVSYRTLFSIATLLAILVVVVLVLSFTYGRLLVSAQRAFVLERENKQLEAQVAQIDSLKLELLNLQALSIQIKGMLGVEMSQADSVLVANLSPAKSPAIGTDEDMDRVGAQEQKQMLEALPSMWPVRGYVTREFYLTGGEDNAQYHPGIDIAAARDTPVLAAAEGVVEASHFDDTYGWMVEIDHGYGISTLYGHCTRNLVNVGDRVTRGKTIATVGSTGKSTAPHLHFEVRKNGVPVDPKDYLLN
jgi:murein DD-endopeptidase MepM/ murein hydrolase activator NlpD